MNNFDSPFWEEKPLRKEGFGRPQYLTKKEAQRMMDHELRSVVALEPAGSDDCRMAARELKRRNRSNYQY